MPCQTAPLPADDPPPCVRDIPNSPPGGAARRRAVCGHHHGASRPPTIARQDAPNPALAGAKSLWIAVVGHPAAEKTA